jgi:hypothetical protein
VFPPTSIDSDGSWWVRAVSISNTCRRVVGESVGAFLLHFSSNMARPHRTWPAIWELGDSWPNGVCLSELSLVGYSQVLRWGLAQCFQGEVDIVEGVNDKDPNASSLHTGPGTSVSPFNYALTWITFLGCTMPQQRTQSG